MDEKGKILYTEPIESFKTKKDAPLGAGIITFIIILFGILASLYEGQEFKKILFLIIALIIFTTGFYLMSKIRKRLIIYENGISPMFQLNEPDFVHYKNISEIKEVSHYIRIKQKKKPRVINLDIGQLEDEEKKKVKRIIFKSYEEWNLNRIEDSIK